MTPEMGTPEWRAYVQTPEWMAKLHGKAIKDDQVWERKQERRSRPLDAMVRELGATGVCSSNVLGRRDFRERFAVDHPDRMDYEESIHGKNEATLMAEDVIKLDELHQDALRVTTIG